MKMDAWIRKKIGLSASEMLTRELLEDYQLIMLKKTLVLALENSRFYGELLAGLDVERDIRRLQDIRRLPFSAETDLRERGPSMVCVPQSEISRIVTLTTSGSTGKPKRVYFTEEDQELTIDFFHNGMQNLVDESDLFLILLPWKRLGCVGDLLARGLARLGTETVGYGQLPRNDDAEDEEVLDLIRQKGVTSMVGGPVEISRLAARSAADFEITRNIRSVLLSTEYVSEDHVRTITDSWDCMVFEHYGMTETGLGGAVSCHTLEGYHPREADLYYEIIDPKTGQVLPDGEWGEVVFTTLTRRGMPFIRYRTGDISRWIPDPCRCGSILKRLDRVQDRQAQKARFRGFEEVDEQAAAGGMQPAGKEEK